MQSLEYTNGYLTDQLLISAPSLEDSCFTRAMVYIAAHSEEGAMGVIVNSVIEKIKLDEVLQYFSLPASELAKNLPVHFGGPVEVHRGFVVHSDEVASEGTIKHKAGICLTANISMLKIIGDSAGPKHAFMALGYAGWGPEQLESEIERGSWIIVPASKKLVFETPNTLKWGAAMDQLGINLTHFSADVGHA